jgi:hypothetical protein
MNNYLKMHEKFMREVLASKDNKLRLGLYSRFS